MRMCDMCGQEAAHRLTFRLDSKPKREIDLCPDCRERLGDVVAHSRPASAKRRHRAYQTRTYEDKTA